MLSASADEEVRLAIVAALRRDDMARFSVEEEKVGRVVIRFARGDERFRVSIDYDRSGFSIAYLDSQGIPTETGADGGVVIHKMYEKWTDRLAHAIVAELQRPAPAEVAPVSEPVTEHVEPEPAAPPVDPNVAIINYVGDELTAAGYTCNISDFGYLCSAPGEDWQVAVSYWPDAQEVQFVSGLKRAFGQPCERYVNHVRDLRAPKSFFSVVCKDDDQIFEMTTGVRYETDLDIAGWMQAHRESRHGARELLDSVGAIRP